MHYPRYLASGPDDRDLYAPGCNEAAIANFPHSWAESSLRSERNASTVNEDDNVLKRFTFNRAAERIVSCFFDLHVGLPAGDRSTGVDYGPYADAGDDGSKSVSLTAERKITSRHGVDSRPLSEGRRKQRKRRQ
jgi:hypothetical protein